MLEKMIAMSDRAKDVAAIAIVVTNKAIDAVAENVFRFIFGLIMLMALFASIYRWMAPCVTNGSVITGLEKKTQMDGLNIS